MSSSNTRRQRRLQIRRVVRYACPTCAAAIFTWPGHTKISHEAPICEGFRALVQRVADKHGVGLEEGASYPALFIDTKSHEPASN